MVTSRGGSLREAEVSDRLEEHSANRTGQEVPWDDGNQWKGVGEKEMRRDEIVKGGETRREGKC